MHTGRESRTLLTAGLVLAALGIVPLTERTALAERSSAMTSAQEQARDAEQDSPQNDAAGAVFAMTNATSGNEIVVYSRASDGSLERLNRRVSTRGLGIGVDTDTQGPLRLSDDHRSSTRSIQAATTSPSFGWRERGSDFARSSTLATNR